MRDQKHQNDKNENMSYKEPIVSFRNFKKSFKNTQIGPISFSIQQGKFVALLGSSGSGKSVVLNSMTGIVRKYEGEIIFNGYNRKKLSSYKANKTMGMYQQIDFSLETLTCQQYLKAYCTYTGVKKENRDKLIKFWLDFFELWSDKDKLIKNFSWGMKNRVNLMLCFFRNPDIYILDEPGANLDSIWRSKINDLFRHLKTMKKTLIVSSHNIDEIVDLIDHYIILHEGRKIFEGHRDELNIYRKYKIILLEKFNVDDFRNFLNQKNIKSFKYDEDENSIIFATNNLIEINWAFLYFIKKGLPILNVTKLPINMESIHKALEDEIAKNNREDALKNADKKSLSKKKKTPTQVD